MSTNLKGSSNHDEVIKLLGELVAIDSVNLDYKGSKNGEAKISDYIYHYLRNLGVHCEIEEVLPNRNNVICYMEGKDHRGLCMESHMDTVSIENMDIEPFNPVIKDGKMYGRGSSDDKGSLAAMMVAIKILTDNKLKPSTDLYFVATVDEEYQHRGVDFFLKRGMKFNGAVVGEPTKLNIITACKGVVRWRITSEGIAGHSSQPDKGRNAIYDMADLIVALKDKLISTYQNKRHPLLGSPSLSVGFIEGGTAVNIIPDKCSIDVDRRLLPGETNDEAKNEIIQLIHQLRLTNEKINIKMSDPTTYTIPMDTNVNQPIVKTAIESCEKIYGESIVEGVDFGCDASSFTAAGIPSVVLGPGDIAQAHTKDEFVSLKEVCLAAEIYGQICIDF